VSYPPRRQLIAGLVAAITIALAITAHAVFSPAVLAHYAESPDSMGIAGWAADATAPIIASWFTGVWIQADSPYYRPLSSVAFWLQYKAFGYNFQGHVFVSWLIHAWICALIYLLALRLLPGTGRQRVISGLMAVLLFNVRLTPLGPHWPTAPIGYAVVAWWPAQTDQWSLAFSLAALLALDGWLQRDRPSGLWQASVLWVTAVLFKEMAVIVPAIAAVLITYRKGLAGLQLYQSTEDGSRRLAPGPVWTVALPGLVAVAAFLALRTQLVRGAWGPEQREPGYLIVKLARYVAGRPITYVIAHWGELWFPVAAVFLVAILVVWVRMRSRPSAVWLVLAMILGAGLIAQVLGGNFALITIPRTLGRLLSVTLFLAGFVALVQVRAPVTWYLLVMALGVIVPVLHVAGPHYHYWPAAFWAIFHASIILWLWERGKRENDEFLDSQPEASV